MTTNYAKRLPYFKEAYVTSLESEVNIPETNPAGSGVVAFEVNRPCIKLLAAPNTWHFFWLKEGKCADGAFILFESDSVVHLHIVELKSRLTHGVWEHARQQFSGMFLNALAFGGVMGIPEFSTITCYIAFKTENLTPDSTASPITLKSPLGGSQPLGKAVDWSKGEVNIAWDVGAQLVKLPRDNVGNASQNLALP